MDFILRVLCGMFFNIGASSVNTKMREQNAQKHLGGHVYRICSNEAAHARVTNGMKKDRVYKCR